MVAPAAGDVVLVTFPFSDLSASKLRPALVLYGGQLGDWLLCQITSNPYADPQAIEITDADFNSGSLRKTSYIRPTKLFTANSTLITHTIGRLTIECHQVVVDAINSLLAASIASR